MSSLITADAADKWLANRVNMPTVRDSSGLSAVPQNIRAHAFFSARVAEARILERLRDVSDAYSRGEINKAEAIGSLKKYLVSEGYMAGDRRNPPPPGINPAAWAAAGRLDNLASTSRLDLILEQNASMAYSVRTYDEGMSERAMRRKPYWQYVHALNGTPAKARADHSALNGKIFAKTDPIWRSIFPPNGFRCHCGVREVSAEEAGRLGVSTPDDIGAMPPPPDFTFDPLDAFSGADISGLQPIDRARILDQAADAVLNQDIGKCGAIVAPPTKGLPLKPLPGEAEVKNALVAMETAAREELRAAGLDPDNLPDYQAVNMAIKKSGRKADYIPPAILDTFPRTAIEVARLDKRFAAALNATTMPIVVSRGSAFTGVIHLWHDHKDMFVNPQKMVTMLQETVGNPNCRCVISFERIEKREVLYGKRTKVAKVVRRIVLHNPALRLYCVLTDVDGVLQLISLHGASEAYGARQWAMK